MFKKIKDLLLGNENNTLKVERVNPKPKSSGVPRDIEVGSSLYNHLNEQFSKRSNEIYNKDWGELDNKGRKLAQNGKMWMEIIYSYFEKNLIPQLDNESLRSHVINTTFLALFLKVQRVVKIMIEQFETIPESEHLIEDNEFNQFYGNERYTEFPTLQSIKHDYTNHIIEIAKKHSCELTREEASKLIDYAVETFYRFLLTNYRVLRIR